MIAPNDDGARKQSGRDGVSLRKFCQRVGHNHKDARCAVKRLESHLGRSAYVADLSATNIDAIACRMRREGLRRRTINNARYALRNMACRAWRMGLIDGHDLPPNLRHVRTKPPRKPKQPPPPPPVPGSLAYRFENEIVSEKRLHKQTIINSRTAIAAFSEYLERPALLTDVDEATLYEFRVARSKEMPVVRYYCVSLRAVARRLDPEQIADRRWKPLPPAEPGTIRHFYETVYAPQRMIGTKKSSRYAYLIHLRMLRRFAKRDPLLTELSDSFVADFFNWLSDKRGAPAVTINSHRARLFALWRYAVDLGILQRDPRIKKLKESRDAPDAWSEEELRRLFDAPLQIRWSRDIGGLPAGKWFRALMLTGYWTGLRRGSLWSIRLCDVDLDKRWLFTPGDTMKNRVGKPFRLGVDAVEAIREIHSDRDMLFPLDINPTTFQKYMRRIIKRAGLPKSRRRACTQMHKLRRSVATIATIKRGINAASDLLGHSSLEITRRYVDPSKLPGQDATEYLPTLTDCKVVGAADQSRESTPADFLAEAQQLAGEARHATAAMTARIALEQAARHWCLRLQVRSRKVGINNMIHRLAQAGQLSADQSAEFKRAANLANKAAHGGSVESSEVAWLLERVAAFLTLANPNE